MNNEAGDRIRVSKDLGQSKDVPFKLLTNEELKKSVSEVITTPEGFKINGKNETSLIRSLKSLNGIPIEKLEKRMRPYNDYKLGIPGSESGGISNIGFLGRNESLAQVLAEDNDTVMGMGLTHQKLADFLSSLDSGNGRFYGHKEEISKGDQGSPFGDGTSTNRNHILTSLNDGAKISYSGLLPIMIHRYGFYEGKGTRYRLDPRKIAEVAGFIPRPENDPVEALVKDKNASVEIKTSDQLERMYNLNVAGINILKSPNYRISPEGVDVILTLGRLFGSSRFEGKERKVDRENIINRIDTKNIISKPYILDRHDSFALTSIMPSDFPQLKEAILKGIDSIEFSKDMIGVEGLISDAERFVERLITDKTIDGKPNPHAEYFAGLLQKIKETPEIEQNIDGGSSSRDSVINKPVSEVAKREQKIEQTLAQLPNSMDEKAREAAKMIIEEQLKSIFPEKVNLMDFIAGLNSQAEQMQKEAGKPDGEKQVITENEVFNECLGLLLPKFKDFLSSKAVKKSLKLNIFTNIPIEVKINKEFLESLPEIESKSVLDDWDKYRQLEIGEKEYKIEKDKIRQGEFYLKLYEDGRVNLHEAKWNP